MLRDFVIHAEGDADLSARTRACAEALAEARPEMAAIGNLVRYWAASFSWPEEDFRACAISHCEAILARADRALAETVANARRRLANFSASIILTHSASSTVRAVLAGLSVEVLVTASEPGGEGRRLATELGAVCVEDSDAPAAVSDVSAVVVGADAISTDAFVNKVGTRVLAETANRTGTPFFVVAESYKWLLDAKSITAGGAFETTPNALVTDFLSDGTFRA